MYKLGLLEENGTETPYHYPHIWSIEKTKGPDRIVIAPAKGQVDLLLHLTSGWQGLRSVLYVLLVSRCGNKPGRYQSPPLTQNELLTFLRSYKSYLESDARHHLWVGLIGSKSLLVYDQHNVIYAYGDLLHYQKFLLELGFSEAPVVFPMPHTHNYHPDNDASERRILSEWDWDWSELAESDED